MATNSYYFWGELENLKSLPVFVQNQLFSAASSACFVHVRLIKQIEGVLASYNFRVSLRESATDVGNYFDQCAPPKNLTNNAYTTLIEDIWKNKTIYCRSMQTVFLAGKCQDNYLASELRGQKTPAIDSSFPHN